ncbi:hypothetical protein N7457_004068 [Penicillium paradoxum]|uniref:uncharacterized protein n=1 Tax=Penicillium paradoxum TaxID=176176 RepID=UPI0025483DBE|nr:uncharacterized protein N7457_004068 [Penicillium paradoxum]KAJ5782294.1 hypothetical protein N7457_004068 [Penicillium paradoxum]
MCNYTYHHYPNCGHISNWSITSCQEYTNRLRLASPEQSIPCTLIETSHNLLSSPQPSRCMQCVSEWMASLSEDNHRPQSSNSYLKIEGLDGTRQTIEIKARMVSDSDGNGDSGSAGHSDNGQSICLGAVVGESGNGDMGSADHSDNGQSICLGAVVGQSGDGDSSSAGHSDNGQSICLGAVVGESGNGDMGSADHSDNGQLICLCAVTDGSGPHCECLCPKSKTKLSNFAQMNPGSKAVADELDSPGGCVLTKSAPVFSDVSQVNPAVVHESDSRGCRRSEKKAKFADFAQKKPTKPEITARIYDWSVSVSESIPAGFGAYGGYTNDSAQIDSLNHETAYSTSSYDSSYESSSCGSLHGSKLRETLLRLRLGNYIQQGEQDREAIETDYDKYNADTFGIDENIDSADPDNELLTLEEMLQESPDSPSVQDDLCNLPFIDIDHMQRRIEATVHKRIEENNTKQARQEAISKLFDHALLQKDKNDRRERNIGLGIEEDPNLWDTESITNIWDPKPTNDIPADASTSGISPCTCTPPKSRPDSRIPGPQPRMHLYQGNLFAATAEDAQKKGLRDVRPYGKHQGEWEGFMRAFSVDDANRMGLLDAEHARGCCDERPANFHLFYGLMHAASEQEAERRWLDDIRRVPGEDGKFYGLLRADDLRHARAMGLTEIQHPWGCCKDGVFTMPDRERHVYTGFMGAVSLDEVTKMGLCEAEPVPGECGEYYGGIYFGYVEAYNESDAFEMGLMEAAHADDCCAKTEVGNCLSIPDAGQYIYYGYMYARDEEEVVNRGLKDALLVPGFDIKYSGYLRAGSEEEAKAMGLFEPSRMEWSGNSRLPEGFLLGSL